MKDNKSKIQKINKKASNHKVYLTEIESLLIEINQITFLIAKENEKADFIKLLKENIEGFKKREADLMKLFQRRQEKHQSKKEDSDLDDLSESSLEEAKTEQINFLNQKILELQNRIEGLEKNQN